jgi:MFS family permease
MLLFSLRLTEVYWVIYLRGKGLSFAAIGLLETIFHVASFSSEVPTGILADRFGRKTSLFAGRVLSACAAALTLLARNWTLLAASFAIQAVSYTCHSGAFDALVYDSLPDERRTEFTRLMGRLNSTYLLGTAAAGVLAAALVRISLDWLYRGCIAVDVVAAAVVLFLPEDVRGRTRALVDQVGGPPRGGFISDAQALFRSLKKPDLRNLLLLWGVSGALGTSIGFYGQSILKDALLPLGMIGVVGTASHLLAIPPSSSAYKIQRKFGQKAPVIAGSLLLPAMVVGMGLVQGSAGWLPRLLVVGLYIAVPVVNETLYPLFSDAVNARTDSANRAAVLSSGSMMFSIAMMVTFPLMGLVGDRLGLRWGIAVAACFTAVCLTPIALALVTDMPARKASP